MKPRSLWVLVCLLAAACGEGAGDAGPSAVRLGYFANVTHAPALVGMEQGWFAAALGPDVRLETNDIGRARLRLAADLPLEPYRDSRHEGSFLVIHPSDGATLAAGIARD